MFQKKRVSIALTAVAGMSLFLAACSSSDEAEDAPAASGETAAATAAATEAAGGAAAAPAAASIEFQDIKFSVTELTATHGQPLEIAMKNTGALEHDFTVDSIDGEATVGGNSAEGADKDVHVVLAPGAEGTLVLTAEKAGTYEFYCSVLGHKEAGMKGTLTVN
ncbi:MAG: hypothetical protein AMXMBFR23_10390 [Chloroflexota bacterium]